MNYSRIASRIVFILCLMCIVIFEVMRKPSRTLSPNKQAVPFTSEGSASVPPATAVTPKSIANIDAASNQLSRVMLSGPVSLSSLSHEGFCTILIFSTSTCGPCKALWRKIPELIHGYPIFRSVYVDCDALEGEDSFLRGLGITKYPGCIVVGPYGNVIGIANDATECEKVIVQLKVKDLPPQPVRLTSPVRQSL